MSRFQTPVSQYAPPPQAIDNPFVEGGEQPSSEEERQRLVRELAAQADRFGENPEALARALFAVNPAAPAEPDPIEFVSPEDLSNIRASALEDMATGDDPADAQLARQLLGFPTGGRAAPDQLGQIRQAMGGILSPEPLTPDGAASDVKAKLIHAANPAAQAFGQAMAPHLKSQMRKAAADWIAISEQMGRPGIMPDQIQDLQQQFQQRYGSIVNMPPTAISREQAAELQRDIKLSEYKEQLPGVPLDFNAKGEIEVIPGYSEFKAAENTRLTKENAARDAAYNRELDLLKYSEPEKPPRDATPEELTEFQHQRDMVRQARRGLYNRFYGPQAQPTQPTAPEPPAPAGAPPAASPQYVAAQQLAQKAGVEFAADQDDVAAFPPGTKFIWAEDGLEYMKE